MPIDLVSLGQVAGLRATMERERAAAALAGTHLKDPAECPIIEAVLKAALFTPRGSRRPWVFGLAMVGPDWLFGARKRGAPAQGRMVLAHVVHHSDYDLAVAWTRKAHRAWRSIDITRHWLASSILSGEVTDRWWG